MKQVLLLAVLINGLQGLFLADTTTATKPHWAVWPTRSNFVPLPKGRPTEFPTIPKSTGVRHECAL